MKITKVSVSARHQFNDPYERFANYNVGVVLDADVDVGEDSEAVVKQLRVQADTLVRQHRAQILAGVEIAHRSLIQDSDQGEELPF